MATVAKKTQESLGAKLVKILHDMRKMSLPFTALVSATQLKLPPDFRHSSVFVLHCSSIVKLLFWPYALDETDYLYNSVLQLGRIACLACPSVCSFVRLSRTDSKLEKSVEKP